MGCRTENVRSRGRTSAKTLIRVMANGRENRECKKSKKQLRKRRTTLCNGKGSHPSWGLERSATSVSHQDSGIKGPTKPHLSPHISHLYLHYISFSSLSLSSRTTLAPPASFEDKPSGGACRLGNKVRAPGKGADMLYARCVLRRPLRGPWDKYPPSLATAEVGAKPMART